MISFHFSAILPLLSLVFLASPAWAQDGGGGLMSNFSVFFPLVALIAIFYFFVIRPQNKRMRDHRDLVAGLRRGDIVVTAGGIVGKVSRVIDDNECVVEIADNVRVKIVKTTITGKHQAASDNQADQAKGAGKE